VPILLSRVMTPSRLCYSRSWNVEFCGLLTVLICGKVTTCDKMTTGDRVTTDGILRRQTAYSDDRRQRDGKRQVGDRRQGDTGATTIGRVPRDPSTGEWGDTIGKHFATGVNKSKVCREKLPKRGIDSEEIMTRMSTVASKNCGNWSWKFRHDNLWLDTKSQLQSCYYRLLVQTKMHTLSLKHWLCQRATLTRQSCCSVYWVEQSRQRAVKCDFAESRNYSLVKHSRCLCITFL